MTVIIENVPPKRKKAEKLRKKIVFCCDVKVSDENSRIRIRTVPNCHGSATLRDEYSVFVLFFQILILVAVSALFLTVYALLFFSLEK
jgi:hypothetical protein